MQVKQIEGKTVLADEKGNEALLKPVQINARCVKPQHELRRHERSALRRKLPTLQQVAPHNREIILVGSGPSIEEELPKIRALHKQGHPLMAIKGAHDWLVERGIIPDFAMAVDPLPRIANLYRKPRYETIYFIASQCHPDTFDALKDQRVVLVNVHTKSAQEYWQDFLKRRKVKGSMYFVGGGSTTGLRAITVAYTLGFRKMHLFGYDSCLKGTQLKATGEVNTGQEIVVVADGKTFMCDGAMSCQSHEFEMQTRMMPGLRVKCYGDGLIPWMSHQMARKGLEEHLLPDETFEDQNSPERGSLAFEPEIESSQPIYQEA